MSFSSHQSQPDELRTFLSSPNTTFTAYGVLIISIIYYVLRQLDQADLSAAEFIWNVLVYLTPSRLISLLDSAFTSSNPTSTAVSGLGSSSTGHAAKGNAMRRILGFDKSGLGSVIQRTRTLSNLGSIIKPKRSKAPPGLGNWDNSCYQNSVLQGLAALDPVRDFLNTVTDEESEPTTSSTLKDLIKNLNNGQNNGKTCWTPAKLKNMSSWQQQDAQEYFSKVLDEIEKDVVKHVRKRSRLTALQGLLELQSLPTDGEVKGSITSTLVARIGDLPDELRLIISKTPLEGLLAQRVGCQRCGYVEGLSLVPFNCMTLPLPEENISNTTHDLETCLDDFTALELIDGVECVKCTLLQAEKQMVALHEALQAAPARAVAPYESVQSQLDSVRQALDDRDFSDGALKKCQIGPKSRVSTTKSRQAVIARAPEALVLHINRSRFNELTGVQSKNYSSLTFPKDLNLDSWCLGQSPSKMSLINATEEWRTDPSKSLLSDVSCDKLPPGLQYRLRAVVTHHGRHENGHYVCYRKSPTHPGAGKDSEFLEETVSSWWSLSDEDVREVIEEHVLAQGGVFMLFYEQVLAPVPDQSTVSDVNHCVDVMTTPAISQTSQIDLEPIDLLTAEKDPTSAHEDEAMTSLTVSRDLDCNETPNKQSHRLPPPVTCCDDASGDCTVPNGWNDGQRETSPAATSTPTPPLKPCHFPSNPRGNMSLPDDKTQTNRDDSNRTSATESIAGSVQSHERPRSISIKDLFSDIPSTVTSRPAFSDGVPLSVHHHVPRLVHHHRPQT
ncbi:uncharacterized protein KY384_004896 [Bacidia gigantensis]|uniref:uncharacterized protein n=1 Tax=Bacidia gigantensis TaxID=2732470 RepID=UPI001D058B46|nr:uncharacterized protein KY384_004896 [Bacidia gigantensis]KAG8530394.1 hypothetical protein KY384_004896 [Bacidia gigantensis]